MTHREPDTTELVLRAQLARDQLSTDDVLGALGLQKRIAALAPAAISPVSMFVAGAVVGAAAALLLSPKSGEAMRHDLTSGAKDLGQRIGEKAHAVQSYVASSQNSIQGALSANGQPSQGT